MTIRLNTWKFSLKIFSPLMQKAKQNIRRIRRNYSIRRIYWRAFAKNNWTALNFFLQKKKVKRKRKSKIKFTFKTFLIKSVDLDQFILAKESNRTRNSESEDENFAFEKGSILSLKAFFFFIHIKVFSQSKLNRIWKEAGEKIK